VSPRDFTIPTFVARLAAVGDLWAALRRAKGVNLELAMKRADGKGTTRTEAKGTTRAGAKGARARAK
jgi:hypothetical protein